MAPEPSGVAGTTVASTGNLLTTTKPNETVANEPVLLKGKAAGDEEIQEENV